MGNENYLERLKEYDEGLSRKCKEINSSLKQKRSLTRNTSDFATNQGLANMDDLVSTYIDIRRDLYNSFPELGELKICDLLKDLN